MIHIFSLFPSGELNGSKAGFKEILKGLLQQLINSNFFIQNFHKLQVHFNTVPVLVFYQ